MEVTNLLSFTERKQLREWLEQNHLSERCCWVACNRSKTPRLGTLPYIDIVEEALCFGWIDSTLKKLPLQNYYSAEEYHQDYLDKNPTGYCHLPESLFEFARQAKEKK